jgi:hypothetical protein
MQGRGRGNVAAERLCGALFVGLTTLKGYFYTNLGGTLSTEIVIDLDANDDRCRAIYNDGDNAGVGIAKATEPSGHFTEVSPASRVLAA